MIVAALVIVVPHLLFDGDWRSWLYQGLAVLIVSCPCALILSSPIAIVSGIARDAAKEADQIETVSGRGIISTISGEKYWLGNEKKHGTFNYPRAGSLLHSTARAPTVQAGSHYGLPSYQIWGLRYS